MRETTPKLTEEISTHCGELSPDKAPAFPVSTFRRLVEQVAKLAYVNGDDLLFFRGQDKDYLNRAGGTTLYPAIYRGDSVPEWEIRHRFDLLDQACAKLVEQWEVQEIEGLRDIRRKRYIQWSILQHYEVAQTPLLDLTHSLRVACSFAQMKGTDDTSYVYVLGLPYITNRITVNSEHELAIIRLLSICPPDALRPHFQEGYMAGTTDVTTDYDRKTELDFRNRLIAKFSIPRAQSRFWGNGFDIIPESSLYPRNDRIFRLCEDIKEGLRFEIQPDDIGVFVREWADIEEKILRSARRITERNISVRDAIAQLVKREIISSNLANELQNIRIFRNNLVHRPRTVQSKSAMEWVERARAASQEIQNLK